MTPKQEIAAINAQTRQVRSLRQELAEELEALEDSANPPCPICHTPTFYLGSLGDRDYYRCQNCGWEYSPAK